MAIPGVMELAHSQLCLTHGLLLSPAMSLDYMVVLGYITIRAAKILYSSVAAESNLPDTT